jgi:hypothetical protein
MKPGGGPSAPRIPPPPGGERTAASQEHRETPAPPGGDERAATSPEHREAPAPPGDQQTAADPARQAASDLAHYLASAAGARDARALQRKGQLHLPEPGLALPGSEEPAARAAPPAQAPATAQEPATAEPAASSSADRRPRPIGIWEPRGVGADLVFVRPAPSPLGDQHAARREIAPKRAPLPLRVCLFGESAAAGYLYAPDLTPAGVLEWQLRAVAGEGAVEVVDLSRTNETLASLTATLESAVQIQPDVVVVFAGNNWNLLETPEISPYATGVAALQRFAEAWRAGGPAGPAALAADRLRGIVAAACERIALIARAIGAPVILVVPEVSLTGWESRQPVRWLPGGGGPRLGEPATATPPPRAGDGNRGSGTGTTATGQGRAPLRGRAEQRATSPTAPPTPAPPNSSSPGSGSSSAARNDSPVAAWYRLFASARRRLARGAWAAAARAATAMIALDGGANPTPWRLLALAHLGRGDEPAAAAAARAEIDAAAYPNLALLGAPQATTLARDLLRQAAGRHGFALVDLPAVFAAHTASPLPGPRLFLDYCHMTAEGFEVAMAAVAAEVLRLSGIAEGCVAGTTPATTAATAAPAGAAALDWRELLRRLPRLAVPPAVEAVARFGAAVHGAHRLLAVGPKAPFLTAWCDAALAASPGIASAMLDLLAARAAPLPALLTAAQGRNLASGHRLGLQHGWRWDHLDADIFAAVVASLDRHGAAAAAAAAEADAQLVARRGLHAAGTDLLDPPYYLWEPLERFLPDVMTFDDLPRRATLRAPWPETGLCLVCDGTRDAMLEITARLPQPPSPVPGLPAIAARRRGTLRLAVNGRPAAAVPLGTSWKRASIRLPQALLHRGRNRLTLAWPAPPPIDDAALAAALARLDQGIAADLHPVFGELYSVIARSL